jgi:hypothetical protein
MHFGAVVYETLDDRREIQKNFESSFPGLVVTYDDMTLDV